MADRRISTESQDRGGDRLKQIAGLIQKLTYAEMKNLSAQIGQIFDIESQTEIPDDILEVAKRLLAQ